MSNLEILYVVGGVTFVAGVLIAFVFPYLKSKGINVPSILNEAKEVAVEVDDVAGIVKDVIPNL